MNTAERLRVWAEWYEAHRGVPTPDIKQAADYIDRLEALLREALIWCPRRGTMWSDTMHKSLSDLGDRIEAALSEKPLDARPANKAEER